MTSRSDVSHWGRVDRLAKLSGRQYAVLLRTSDGTCPRGVWVRLRPIIFSGEMVRAILDGRKTQTRRVVSPAPGRQREWLTHEMIQRVPHGEMCSVSGSYGWQMHHPLAGTGNEPYDSPLGWVPSPYGGPGDRLWVRETCAVICEDGDPQCPHDSAENERHRVEYRADTDAERPGGWPAEDAEAPRWRSPRYMPRWASRITLEVVSVRVQRLRDISEEDARAEGVESVESFATLWDSINGKDPAKRWEANPLVWAVEFRRVEQ